MRKSQVAIAVTAAMGASQAYAADWVLVDVFTSSGANGASAYLYGQTNFSADPAGNLFSDGGVLNLYSYAGVTWLTTERLTNWDISSAGNSSATAYSCIEGAFGSVVGANICGNYNFGANKTNESSIDGVGGRTLGGDDIALGPAQSLAGNYSGMDPWPQVAVNSVLVPDYFAFGTDVNAFTTQTINPDGSGPGLSGNPPATNGKTLTFLAPGAARDDTGAAAAGGAPISIPIGANDIGWFPGATVAESAASSLGGTFTIVPDATNPKNISVNYTPAAGAGTDTWEYTVTDGPDGTLTPNDATATVTVTVSLAGTANDDAGATTRLLAPVVIPIGVNDVGFATPSAADIELLAEEPTDGTVSFQGNNGPANAITATYTTTKPLYSPTYTDEFTYRMCDGGVCDKATVTVTVNNEIPVAGDLAGLVLDTQGVSPADVSIDIDAADSGAGDIDIAGNNLGDGGTVGITTPGNDVTTQVNGGVITITAASFTSAGDAVGYTTTDLDTEEDTGTISVSIPDVTPALTDVNVAAIKGEPITVTVPVTAPGNGAPSDHQPPTVTGEQFGTVSNIALGLNGGAIEITFDYAPTTEGTEALTVSLEDGDGSIGTATASIAVADKAPILQDVSANTTETGAIEVIVPITSLGDGDITEHTASVSGAQWGNVTDFQVLEDDVDGNGMQVLVTYLPTGFAATDSLEVSLTDVDGSVGTSTVTITISGNAVTQVPQTSLPGKKGKALSPLSLSALLLGLPLLRRLRRKRR